MYGFFATISALAEIWSLTAVSLDRLQAINNPLNAQKRITKSQVLTIKLQSLEHKKELCLDCRVICWKFISIAGKFHNCNSVGCFNIIRSVSPYGLESFCFGSKFVRILNTCNNIYNLNSHIIIARSSYVSFISGILSGLYLRQFLTIFERPFICNYIIDNCMVHSDASDSPISYQYSISNQKLWR